MLNRIEDLMVSMQQVTNNVAHDLRSPLTRLRNRLEVTLLEERDPQNYRQVMDEVIGDADSLIHTFNAMLSIARLEAGIDSAQWEETRIGDLAGELSEIRNYCETDVLNTWLVDLRFQLMRGHMDQERYERECDIVRKVLQASGQEHLQAFEQAWEQGA